MRPKRSKVTYSATKQKEADKVCQRDGADRRSEFDAFGDDPPFILTVLNRDCNRGVP